MLFDQCGIRREVLLHPRREREHRPDRVGVEPLVERQHQRREDHLIRRTIGRRRKSLDARGDGTFLIRTRAIGFGIRFGQLSTIHERVAPQGPLGHLLAGLEPHEHVEVDGFVLQFADPGSVSIGRQAQEPGDVDIEQIPL